MPKWKRARLRLQTGSSYLEIYVATLCLQLKSALAVHLLASLDRKAV